MEEGRIGRKEREREMKSLINFVLCVLQSFGFSILLALYRMIL